MPDSGDPFGEFFRGKNDEELTAAVSGIARLLGLYYSSPREQGFDKAAAMMLVLQVQDNIWPKAAS